MKLYQEVCYNLLFFKKLTILLCLAEYEHFFQTNEEDLWLLEFISDQHKTKEICSVTYFLKLCMNAYAYYAYDLWDTVDWGRKIPGLIFSNKLDWGSYIISVAKTASKIIGDLIRSMKFLTPDVALHFYKSTIRPWMEYCCHVWTGALSCYLELLGKLRKWIYRTAGSFLASTFFTKPLRHCQNVASVSFLYTHYFGRC